MADAVDLPVQRFIAADGRSRIHLGFQLIHIAVNGVNGAQSGVEILRLLIAYPAYHIIQFIQRVVDQHALTAFLHRNTAGNHVPHLIRQVLHQHSADFGGTGRQCNIRAIALCQHNQQTGQHAHR